MAIKRPNLTLSFKTLLAFIVVTGLLFGLLAQKRRIDATVSSQRAYNKELRTYLFSMAAIRSRPPMHEGEYGWEIYSWENLVDCLVEEPFVHPLRTAKKHDSFDLETDRRTASLALLNYYIRAEMMGHFLGPVDLKKLHARIREEYDFEKRIPSDAYFFSQWDNQKHPDDCTKTFDDSFDKWMQFEKLSHDERIKFYEDIMKYYEKKMK